MIQYSSNENVAEKEELLKELNKTIIELNIALENYESAMPELVDYYSYQIKAIQAKYDYLLKLTKDMNLSKF